MANDQSNISDNRVIYNLDDEEVILAPNSDLGAVDIGGFIGVQMQQMASLAAAFDAMVKPVREMMKVVQQIVEETVKPIVEAFRSMTAPLSFLLSTKPIYFVAPSPALQERLPDKHLSIGSNDYGFFVINGEPLNILHPSSSRCGRLLAALLKQRAKTVSYEELQEEIGSGDLKKTFKDLKYQLKKRGYLFDYSLVRTEGIALLGLQLQ